VNEVYHTGGGNNFGKYTDPVVDQALDQARAASDVAGRKAALKTFQQRINDQVPVIWTIHNNSGPIYRKNLGGAVIYGYGNALWDRFGFTSKQ
jgi:peptide/nickel transport system substrate-binding protein